MKSIESRVRAVRKSNKLSQTEFAESIGVTVGVISNIELGRITQWDTKTPLLNLICDKYGCRREWLIDGEGEMMQELSREQEIIKAVSDMFTGDDSFNQDIISMLVKLPGEHWGLLEDMARRLMDEQSKLKEAEQ